MTEPSCLRQAQRRRLLHLLALLGGAGAVSPAFALSLADLTNTDASQGIKAALTQGAQVAVSQLGQSGGLFQQPPAAHSAAWLYG